MKKRLALTTTAVVAIGLVPVVGANAQYAPEPGGPGFMTQRVLPIEPGGNTAFKPVKKAKKVHKVHKVAKLPYLGRH